MDPYQPAEQQYQLTRSIINILKAHYNPFSIITKSPSILQDMDIYREMAKMGLVRVFFSVGTLDHEVLRKLQPQAPKPEKRIEAMGEMVRNDLRVIAFSQFISMLGPLASVEEAVDALLSQETRLDDLVESLSYERTVEIAEAAPVNFKQMSMF